VADSRLKAHTGEVNSEDSEPFDHELDYELFLQREEDKANRSPAEWWDDLLDSLSPPVREEATRAVDFLVSAGCRRGDLLQGMRAISDYCYPTPSRDTLLAHARKAEDLRRRSADLCDRLLLFGSEAASTVVQVLHELDPALEAHIADLTHRAGAIRRDSNMALNREIYRLVRQVERATGQAHYAHLRKLLEAVGVIRTPGALKALASRKARKAGDTRRKKTTVRLVRKKTRGRPRKNEAMKRHGGREVRIGDDDALAALEERRSRYGKRKPGLHD